MFKSSKTIFDLGIPKSARHLWDFKYFPLLFFFMFGLGEASIDSLNVRIHGSWPFGPSYAVVLDTIRHLAFLSSGGGVYVVDFAGGNFGTILSDDIRTIGVISKLEYDYSNQNLIIACDEGGFEIWNVSNPDVPQRMSRNIFTYQVRDISLDDTLLYIAAGHSGAKIFNISNPYNPVLIGQYSPGPCYSIESVAAKDFLCFLGTDIGLLGLLVLNVSNPANPVPVDTFPAIHTPKKMTIADSMLYYASGRHLFGYKILNPITPVIPIFDIDFEVEINDFHVGTSFSILSGDELFLFSMFVNPPQLISQIQLEDNGNDLEYYHNTIWAALSGGLQIIDISQPDSPATKIFIPTEGKAWDAKIYQGRYLVVADGEGGLKILDIQNPGHIHKISELSLPGNALRVELFDHYAIVCTEFEGLRVVDISEINQPVEVASWDDIFGNPSVDVAIHENYLYVALKFGGMRIFKFEDNPPHLDSLGVFPPDYPRYVIGVDVQYPYAYVVDWDEGLWKVLISDPWNPVSVGSCELIGFGSKVDVSGQYAYVTDDLVGLDIISITLNPSIVSTCTIPEYDIRRVKVSSGYAIVTVGPGGFRVVDINDPNNPEIVGYYTTEGFAEGISIDYPYVVVSQGDAGVYIYELTMTGTEESPGSDNDGIRVSLSTNELVVFSKNRVTLQIFDITGREILKEKGKYIRFRPETSGLYLWNILESREKGRFIYIAR